jgi:signal transduction histidine kinase
MKSRANLSETRRYGQQEISFSAEEIRSGKALSGDPGHRANGVSALLRYVEPIQLNASCQSVLSRFLASKELYALPVIDKAEMPIALLDRTEYVEFFSQIYTVEVFGRVTMLGLLKHPNYVGKETILIDANCSLHDAAQIFVERGAQHMISGFVVTKDGRYIGIVNGLDLLKAISERRQGELIAFNEMLEKRVAERTAELEGFMYSISHDFKSPIRAINGFATLLLQKLGAPTGEETTKYLDRILTNSRRMGNLLEDLLDLSRYSIQELNKSELDMRSKVVSVISELADEIGEVKFDIGLLPASQGDPTLIRQVWTNLISNAIKYSAKVPNPVVRIGFENGQYFVSDNGTGFDMAYAEKLFKLFSRLHLDGEYSGTGVGLAIVKRIVERHGGHVKATGVVGSGAWFSFTLPT